MDLCTGGDLTTRKLNESEVVIVAEQILRGVVYLHRNGVCHQDLKLENIYTSTVARTLVYASSILVFPKNMITMGSYV